MKRCDGATDGSSVRQPLVGGDAGHDSTLARAVGLENYRAEPVDHRLLDRDRACAPGHGDQPERRNVGLSPTLFGEPEEPDEVGRDHDRRRDAVGGDGVEDEVGVEPTRHDHGASRQEKADRAVRSCVVQRPDDEVRAQSCHVVARHRLQAIVHRRSDLVGKLDCLGPAGSTGRVDQVRRRGQIAPLTSVRRRFDAGRPTTRVLHLGQHEESVAARRRGCLGEELAGGPDRVRRAIFEEILHFARREVVVDEDRADTGQDRRRVDQKRLTGVVAEYGQSGSAGEIELEQCVRHPDDAIFDVAPRQCP